MMSYELFKTIVVNKIKEYMPPDYENYVVDVHTLTKVNQKLDCMNLMPVNPDDPDEIAMPNIYLEHMYEDFQKCQDLNLVLQRTAAAIDYASKNLRPLKTSFVLEEKRDRIVLCLINIERNLELLETIPHRSFLDLCVVYRFYLEGREGQYGSILVTNSILKDLGMKEETLYELAKKNMKRLFPTVISPLADVIRSIAEKGKLPNKEMALKHAQKSNLILIGNKTGFHGAANILLPDTLEETAEQIQANFYLMPSSIHEFLAISEQHNCNVKLLEDMVRQANRQDFMKHDILSDSVYYYDRALKCMSLVTGTGVYS